MCHSEHKINLIWNHKNEQFGNKLTTTRFCSENKCLCVCLVQIHEKKITLVLYINFISVVYATGCFNQLFNVWQTVSKLFIHYSIQKKKIIISMIHFV